MTLTAHRPARIVASLQGDDPAELAADLPRLPHGTTLDPQVLRDAACGEQDLDLFYPEPGDLAAEQAAKQVCAGCPVREPCLDMALATGDTHAILGGTTPAERARLRTRRDQTRRAERATQRAAATGIDPTQLKQAATGSMRAHLFADASATVSAFELCKTAGLSYVARMLGVHVTDLTAALQHWGLEVPRLRKPAEILDDPAAARQAFTLVEQVGWVKAAQQTRVARRTLRAAFQQWGLGEPQPHAGPCAPSRVTRDRAAAEAAMQLAIEVGVNAAAERVGVDRATLYLAWKRWGLGKPTDRADGARAARERWAANARMAPAERHPWRLDRSVWQPTRSGGPAERERAIG
jgi:WhiB family redox-sensing transcriptional regulator